MKKALIAMSGGVDSSVAALLMKEKGYECMGVTMKLFNNGDICIPREHSCCSLEDVEDARYVSNTLGMPHYVFNFTDRFKEDVIDKFVIKFSESTKDAFDKKRLTEAFEKYLYKQVEAEEKINQNFNIDDKSDMESLLKYVTDDVIKLPLEQKRQMLIRDESFETIRSISNNAFEMAQEAYTSKSDNIDETKVDEMQKKLNELLKSVKAFNKQQAIWLVSEGILDLNFVKNPKTDIMSIRLRRCLQSK